MKYYKYRIDKTLPIYFVLIVGAAFFVTLLAWGWRLAGDQGVPVFMWCVLFALPTMFLAGALLAFWIWRPIGVGDAGIATYLFGKQRTFLAWSSVTKVERVRFYSSAAMRFRFEFWIYAADARIRFDDYIDHLAQLVETLNGYISQHHIHAFEVDRGRETRRAPVATLAALAQGDRLEGRRKSTARF